MTSSLPEIQTRTPPTPGVSGDIPPHEVSYLRISSIEVDRETKFQRLQIAQSEVFGRCLVLDGLLQSSERDEHLYHEALVHPAMLLHRGPVRDVLVLGGGEGATLREVLRYDEVSRGRVVDIDGEVIDACREYMPSLAEGSFEDPRAELIVGDAKRHVQESDQTWDVIFQDLIDPSASMSDNFLFTREFFDDIASRLSPGGFFGIQCGSAALHDLDTYSSVVNTLASVFPFVETYTVYVPSFLSTWGLALASKRPIALPSPEGLDRQIESRVRGSLKLIDGRALLGLLHAPKHLRQAVEDQTRIIDESLIEAPKM